MGYTDFHKTFDQTNNRTTLTNWSILASSGSILGPLQFDFLEHINRTIATPSKNYGY